MLNVTSRSILINTFCIVSIFNPRWKKLSFLMTEFSLMIIFVSIFLTSDENVDLSAQGLIMEYSILSMIATDFTMYLIAFFFKFPYKDQKRLFTLLTQGGQLKILQEWEIFQRKLRKRAILGMIIYVGIWIYSLYSSFGFTLVWKFQRMAFIECFGITLVFNFIIGEILIELFIALLFLKRKNNFFLRAIAKGLNDLRNFRCLSP